MGVLKLGRGLVLSREGICYDAVRLYLLLASTICSGGLLCRASRAQIDHASGPSPGLQRSPTGKGACVLLRPYGKQPFARPREVWTLTSILYRIGARLAKHLCSCSCCPSHAAGSEGAQTQAMSPICCVAFWPLMLHR